MSTNTTDAGRPATATASGPEPVRPTVTDPERWPDVARVPQASAARTAISRAVVRRALAALPLRVAYGSQVPGWYVRTADQAEGP